MSPLVFRMDFLAVILTACNLLLASATEPKLVVQPNLKVLVEPAGKSYGIMCSGESDDDGPFTDMKWIDPNGDEIQYGTPGVKKFDSSLKLSFVNPTVEDSGVYKCTALHGNTLPLAVEVTMEFYDDIKFENCPEVQNLIVNREGRINCQPVGDPKPSINWEKDQKPVGSDRVLITTMGLEISSVRQEDAGMYVVEAFVPKTGRNKYMNVEVNVLTPPKINDLPEEFTAIQGEEYTITCGAQGSAPITYTWYDPQLRNLSSEPGYKVEEGRLTIFKVEKNAGGVYTCKVINPAGEDTATVKIEVQVKPNIVELKNLTSEETKDAMFECRAEGVPRPTMTIRKDTSNQDIEDNPEEGIELEVTDEGEFKVLRLRLTSVKRSDDGLYYCKASNPAGVAEKIGHLEVQFRPDMSKTFPTTVKTWSGNPANLSCVAEANPNATITWKFQNELVEPEDERYRIQGSVSYSSLLVLTQNRVNYEVFGKYTCEAKNALGENFIDINLDEATAPGQVTQIVFDKVTSTTITFRLMGPSNTGGMPVTHYIIRYKRTDQPIDTMRTIEWPKDTPYILGNLKPRAKYQFSVAARNVVGDGPWKTADYVMPEETVPEPPQIMVKPETVSDFADRFEVRWMVPSDNGEPITKFDLRYFKVERNLNGWTQLDKAIERTVKDWDSSPSYELTNLTPDTSYKIEIRATNKIGNSLPESVVFKTRAGQTSPNNQVSPKDDNEVYIIIAAVVLVVLLVTLVILDVVCFFRNHCGLLHLIRHGSCSSSSEKIQGNLEDGKACVKEVSTANNGKIKTEMKSPSSPDLPPPDKLSAYDEKPKTEMDNPAFENRDVRPADLIIDDNYKNKSPKGSKTSIGKSSPV